MKELPNLKIVNSLAELNNEAVKLKLEQILTMAQQQYADADNDRRIVLLQYIEALSRSIIVDKVLDFIYEHIDAEFKKEPVEHKTRVIKYLGKSYSRVLSDLVKPLTYPFIQVNFKEKAWSINMKMYQLVISDEEYSGLRAACIDRFKSFAKYRLIAKDEGKRWVYFTEYLQQKFVVEKLEALINSSLSESDLELYLAIFGELLEPEAEGQYSTSEMITLNWAPVSPSQEVQKIRHDSIGLLFTLLKQFLNNPTLSGRIIDTISKATELPTRAQYGEDFEQMVFKDVKTILTTLLTIASDVQNYNVLRQFERIVDWANRRFKKGVSEEVKAFKDFIQKDSFYSNIYKLLAKSHHDVEDIGQDWQKRQLLRRKNLSSLVKKINSKNTNDWVANIQKVQKNLPEENGEYTFLEFLSAIGREGDKLAVVSLINKLISEHFINYYVLIIGLKQVDSESADTIIDSIIKSGDISLISSIPLIYVNLKDTDVTEGDFDTLKNLFANYANKLSDEEADNFVFRIFKAILLFSTRKELEKDVEKMLKGILTFTQGKHIFGYIDALSMADYRKQISISNLDTEIIDIILSALVKADSLNHRAEELLIKWFDNHYTKIFQLFKQRIEHEITLEKTKPYEFNRYDAIPYDFGDTSLIIASPNYTAFVNLIIDNLVLNKDWKFQWEGASLLRALTRVIDDKTKGILESRLDKDKTTALGIVRILDSYHYDGKEKYSLVKKIIDKYGNDEEVRSRCATALHQTGVVTGDDGMTIAYQEKLELVKKWKLTNKNTELFVKEFTKGIEERIKNESKRTEEEKALRKLKYD